MKTYAFANQAKCGGIRICMAHAISKMQTVVETCIVPFSWLAKLVNNLSLIYFVSVIYMYMYFSL